MIDARCMRVLELRAKGRTYDEIRRWVGVTEEFVRQCLRGTEFDCGGGGPGAPHKPVRATDPAAVGLLAEVQRSGFTDLAIAQQAGLSPAVFVVWRRGRSVPTKRSIERVLQAIVTLKECGHPRKYPSHESK